MSRGLFLTLVLMSLIAASAAEAKSPARNGRVVFAGYSALYSARPDGTGRRVVVEPWGYDDVSASPDGRSLVAAGSEEIAFLSPIDGAVTDRLFMRGRSWIGHAVFSPDGRQVAFHRCEKTVFTDIEECIRYGVYRARIAGGPNHRVGQGMNPEWSSDGHSLMFVHGTRPDASGYRCAGLYTVRLPSGRPHHVVPQLGGCSSDSGEFGGAQFIDRDRRVLYRAGRSIWSVRLDGTRRRRLLQTRQGVSPLRPRLSPDRRRLVYATHSDRGDGGGVWVASARGGRGGRIYDQPVLAVTWLPVASGRSTRR